ncbi:hypothetical protein ACYJW8_09090 [Frateuria aurantia]
MHEPLITRVLLPGLLGLLGPLASQLWLAWCQQQGRLRLLEYRLDILQRQAGIEPLQALRQECMPLLQANRSLEAIRLFRQRTGADQRSARTQVRAWMGEVAAAAAVSG